MRGVLGGGWPRVGGCQHGPGREAGLVDLMNGYGVNDLLEWGQGEGPSQDPHWSWRESRRESVQPRPRNVGLGR